MVKWNKLARWSCALVGLLVFCPYLKSDEVKPQPVAYILVVDHSGSMGDNDPFDIRLDAATLVVDSGNTNDRVGVVGFGIDSKIMQELAIIDDKSKSSIGDRIHAPPEVDVQGTDIIGALKAARDLVNKALVDRVRPEIMLLTDGKMEGAPLKRYPNLEAALADELKVFSSNGVPVHCIALGGLADNKFLRTCAAATGGSYFPVKTSEELLAVYLQMICARKGMVSLSANRFYVWPGSEEVNVIVFNGPPKKFRFGKRDEPARIAVIQSSGGDVRTTYRSSERKNPPQAYDFARIDQPRGGDWSVEAKGTGQLQIHALQSVPFDFVIEAPQIGKKLVGTPVLFRCKVVPKPRIQQAEFEKVFANTSVKIALVHPNGEKNETSLVKGPADEGFFESALTFKEPGDYLVDFQAEFRASSGSVPWTYTQRKIFRVGPPDFGIEIQTPGKEAALGSPLDKLLLEARLIKVDTSCTADLTSVICQITNMVLNDKGLCVQQSVFESKGGAVASVLSGEGAALLDPGKYQLVVSAGHPQYSVAPTSNGFSIGQWPKLPVLTGLIDAKANMDPLYTGDSLKLKAALSGPDGAMLKRGSSYQSWRPTQIKYEFRKRDRDGERPLVSPPVDLAKADGADVFFTDTATVDGVNTFSGHATILFELWANGKTRHQDSKTVDLEPCQVNVKKMAILTVTPRALCFTNPPAGETLPVDVKVESDSDDDLDVEWKTDALKGLAGDSIAKERILPSDGKGRLGKGQSLSLMASIKLGTMVIKAEKEDNVNLGKYAGSLSLAGKGFKQTSIPVSVEVVPLAVSFDPDKVAARVVRGASTNAGLVKVSVNTRADVPLKWEASGLVMEGGPMQNAVKFEAQEASASVSGQQPGSATLKVYTGVDSATGFYTGLLSCSAGKTSTASLPVKIEVLRESYWIRQKGETKWVELSTNVFTLAFPETVPGTTVSSRLEIMSDSSLMNTIKLNLPESLNWSEDPSFFICAYRKNGNVVKKGSLAQEVDQHGVTVIVMVPDEEELGEGTKAIVKDGAYAGKASLALRELEQPLLLKLIVKPKP